VERCVDSCRVPHARTIGRRRRPIAVCPHSPNRSSTSLQPESPRVSACVRCRPSGRGVEAFRVTRSLWVTSGKTTRVRATSHGPQKAKTRLRVPGFSLSLCLLSSGRADWLLLTVCRRGSAARARGPSGRCARRDPQRRTRPQSGPRAAEGPTALLAALRLVRARAQSRRLGLVVGGVLPRGRKRRASPVGVAAIRRGAVTALAPFGGMTRTDNKPLFRNRSAARSALLDERARAKRASLAPSEALLWARLRGRRLGPVFRRQVPLLGRSIADFLAPAERLVIEVDGGHHAEQAGADARRDAVLARAGYRIVRLDAALVIRDIEAAVSLVSGCSRSSPEPRTHKRKKSPASGAGDSLFSSISVSVGAGRFDGCHHRGRLLMRD
jgi:very-short-patch-repair endonuclease